MNDRPQPPQSDQNLPVPFEQSIAVARPPGGRTPPPQSWQTGEPEPIPWGQYFDALRRRWWAIVLVVLAGSYLGWMYSKTIPAEYTAMTKVFVPISVRGDIGGPIQAPSVLTPNSLKEFVTTIDVVVPVVRRLNLNVHFKRADSALFRGFSYDSVFFAGSYRFAVDSTGAGYVLTHAPRSDNPTQETGLLGEPVGRKFGLHWQPPTGLKPKQIVDFSVQDVTIEALGMMTRLATNLEEEGGQILTLVLRGNDRELIAPTLNLWTQEFIDYVTAKKRASLSDRRRIIEDQLAQATAQRDAAQRALQKFREDNVFAPTETTLPSTSLASQQSQLDQIKRDRDRIKIVLDRAPGQGKIEVGRISVPSILSVSPALQGALVQLTSAEQNLQTQRASFAEGSLFVQRARAEYNAVNDTIIPGILQDIDRNFAETERVLSDELDSRRGELAAMPKRMFDGATLQRNYDQAVALWTTLNTTAQSAKLIDEQTTSDLTVLGEAITPPAPSSSRGPRIFILAVAASIGAGLAIALLLDRLDRRFRYPQQATMELGLTIAGTIPFFKPNRKGELNLTASAQVVESFRTLRLATQYHFPPGEPVIVCISSPGPGEGKSLVSSNLAVAFANAGQKTLLIDGDVRRGVVHTTFEAERRPGLVDYLGGTATAAQIVRPTSTDHLFIVPSGSRSRRAPELLTSERMGALVVEMRSQFEVIIIDSAPFVAGMDAFALGAAAGTMLVVLRPGLTDRKLAENKLELLDRLPVTIIGAVLNAISAGRAYRYYSEYQTYEGEDEGPDEADFDGPNPPTSPTRLIGRR